MKKTVLFFAIFLFTQGNILAQDKGWKLIYHNNGQGKALAGDIEALITAVRAGKKIRVYWSSQRPNDAKRKVEHFADAKFLTVMSDAIVFAQIDPIIGQTPVFDEQTITLKENLEWSFIAASNGKSDTMMRNVKTGEILGHQKVNFAIKWFVLN